jgi:hypothetical protein
VLWFALQVAGRHERLTVAALRRHGGQKSRACRRAISLPILTAPVRGESRAVLSVPGEGGILCPR